MRTLSLNTIGNQSKGLHYKLNTVSTKVTMNLDRENVRFRAWQNPNNTAHSLTILACRQEGKEQLLQLDPDAWPANQPSLMEMASKNTSYAWIDDRGSISLHVKLNGEWVYFTQHESTDSEGNRHILLGKGVDKLMGIMTLHLLETISETPLAFGRTLKLSDVVDDDHETVHNHDATDAETTWPEWTTFFKVRGLDHEVTILSRIPRSSLKSEDVLTKWIEEAFLNHFFDKARRDIEIAKEVDWSEWLYGTLPAYGILLVILAVMWLYPDSLFTLVMLGLLLLLGVIAHVCSDRDE